MEGKVNYTVVGIFVVALTVVLFVTVFWLSTNSHGKLYRAYVVYVQEDVTGLSIESAVRFNGVKVGFVESIRLDRKNPRLVKILLRIAPDVPITTTTFATLNAQGITGVIYVNLKTTTQNAPPIKAKPGEPYPVIPSHPSLLMQLNNALPQVAAQVQQLSASVAQLLNQQNRENIQSSLKNIAIFSRTLADNSDNFTRSMQSMSHALDNIAEASKQFPKTVTNFNNTLHSVDTLSAQMQNTSKNMDATLVSSRRAITNFSNQVMPSAEQALNNLAAASANINQMTIELQHDPSMLVRGKQPSQKGPGE
ncbi:MAG: hypothetical protein A3E84_04685 [Gammaproteobacteria bacterium RIFCSPHIGHO2_12_FULL_42_13]|nr:MAG: hypothetical protein A3E84_04685 [Gammaproteobacteria bacterium RIFCSPHIGHO2_12_FULL_42_13]